MGRLECKGKVMEKGAGRPNGHIVKLERIIIETLDRLFISLIIIHDMCNLAEMWKMSVLCQYSFIRRQ